MAQKSILYKTHTFDISYEILNPKAKVDIVFLHGWGSHKELMRDTFKKYLEGFRHIYIDLPGFGNSTAPIALNSYDYARIVELFLLELNGKKDIIVGHSFGGKVATLLQPEFLVLLSSAGIKRKKPLAIQAKIVTYKLLKLFGLTKLRDFFVADDAKKLTKQMYESFKIIVNEDFKEEFASFDKRALICWGNNDSATPLEDGEAIAKLIKDSRFIEYDGDHYFFLKHAKSVATQIQNEYIALLQKD